jgi:hypothetical protein
LLTQIDHVKCTLGAPADGTFSSGRHSDLKRDPAIDEVAQLLLWLLEPTIEDEISTDAAEDGRARGKGRIVWGEQAADRQRGRELLHGLEEQSSL